MVTRNGKGFKLQLLCPHWRQSLLAYNHITIEARRVVNTMEVLAAAGKGKMVFIAMGKLAGGISERYPKLSGVPEAVI